MSSTSSSQVAQTSTCYIEITSVNVSVDTLHSIGGINVTDEQVYVVPRKKYIALESGTEAVFIERILPIHYTVGPDDYVRYLATKFEVMTTRDEEHKVRYFLARTDAAPKHKERGDKIEAKLLALYGLPTKHREKDNDTRLPVEERLDVLITLLTPSLKSVGERLETLERLVLCLQEEIVFLREKRAE
jgi:hypothetical protein